MQVAAERASTRGNKFFLDFNEGSERAGQRGQDAIGIAESLQQRLRALRETFAFGI